MDLATMRDTCAQQEALLRFETFDRATAWELGSLMVAELQRREGDRPKLCVNLP